MGTAHRKPGAKKPSIFEKPMDNPFNEYAQQPVPKGQEKPPLDKPLENPFKGIERVGKKGPSASAIPKRMEEIAHMPPRREVPYNPAKAEETPSPGNVKLVKEKKKTA